MKFKLPILGEINTGKDANVVREIIRTVDKKEKTFAGGLLDWFKGDGLSSLTKVSSKVLEANKGWVYRNNDVIAKEVATIEFELYKVRVVGDKLVFTKVMSHPVLDLLDKFNDFTASSDGFYVTQSHKKLSGDSFWYLEGNGSNIDSIYILPPDKVEIKPGKIDGSNITIESYEYNDIIGSKKIQIKYSPEQIIHFRSPNPKNYLRGLGAVEAAADDIDTDWMAIEANKMIFKRGLIGNFVLTTDKGLTDEQRKQLRTEFRASYQGLENAFKVPILGGGLKPKTIQLTNKDMEFIAQQEWVRDKITSIFGNSKAVLGVTDDVNRANAEATIENWKRTTITAEMKQITDTLNEFLVPRYSSNLVLGFKSPVPEGRTDKIDEIKSLIEVNVITPNEAREMIGLDPLPDADTLRENLSIPLIPKSLRNVNYIKVLRKNKMMKELDKNITIKNIARARARKLIKSKKYRGEKYKRYWERQIHIVEATEKIFQHKLEKFIDKLVRKAISEVPNEIHDMQGKQLFDNEDEVAAAVLDFEPILSEVALSAGSEAMNLIDSSKPYILKDFRDEIRKRIELFAGSMINTDKDKLLNIITDGVREGLSVPQIRSNITDTFEVYSKTQAERITRTEVLRVSNRAALDAWDQSGVVEGKQWLTAQDDRVDEECEIYDGQIVNNLTGNFFSPENEFEDGDPPLHVNCRCIVIPIVTEL